MAQPSHSINVAQDYFSDLGGQERIEKEVHCFGGGTGIACRGAVGPSSTANVRKEKLETRSDAAPTSDWPGFFIGPATDAARA
jgi:hypothetical protein